MMSVQEAVEKRPDGQRPPRPPQPERKKVLVVTHGDGWIECYADKTVDVRIAQRLHTENDATATLVDAYLEASLPKCYRRLYWPVKCRAVGQCATVTPEDMLERRLKLDIIEALREFGEGGRR